MHTNCQIEAMAKTKGPSTGIKPTTFNTPGDCAKPRVRASCPQLAFVSGVFNMVVPTKYVIHAQSAQPANPNAMPTTRPIGPFDSS